MSRPTLSSAALRLAAAVPLVLGISACSSGPGTSAPSTACIASPGSTPLATGLQFGAPLVGGIFTADPAAHVFDGKIYVYTSHDRDTNLPHDMWGSQFDMTDYHVLTLDDMTSAPKDLGQILHIKDVPWAFRQMWAPDAAYKNGTYYLYFPAHDKQGIFRVGVATSSSPAGPFVARREPIPGSFSIDPAVFTDDDGQTYMYFGGLWGGQLEKWQAGTFDASGTEPPYGPTYKAIGPRVAKLSADMVSFDGPAREVSIVGEDGKPIAADDFSRHYFEAPWMHKYNGRYYLSYSTGQTQHLAYAVGDSPWGPFVYKGFYLAPVEGWTTHGSIVQFEGDWYLFYHDAALSGDDHKRCAKVTPLTYNPDGTIQTIYP